jgi:hypothetical protein
MDTARSNVTSINRFKPSRPQIQKPGASPIDECRDMSVQRLADALAECLHLAAGKLCAMADKAVGLDQYHLHMDALELARDHGAEIIKAYRTDYLDRFNRARRRTHVDRADADAEERLSLVEQDDLEESLAGQALANAIYNACAEELFGLDKRIGMLINDPELELGDNPLGPEIIGAAVTYSLNALDSHLVGIKVRLLLMSLLSKSMPERVKGIYQDLNRQLVKRGVLPSIRVGMKRQRQPDSGPAGQAMPAHGASSTDLFASLQQLMRLSLSQTAMTSGQPGTLQPAGVPDGGMGESAPAPLIEMLNRMQQVESGGVARLDPEQVPLGRINILHSIKQRGVGGTLAPMATMTLDIVAMLFDVILEDKRIPDAMKALIGRLQIPLLKAALLDQSLFSQKAHPGRLLLDTLAEAAIGWDADEGHDSGLYRKVDELVQRILKQFDNRVEVLAEAQADLHAYLQSETEQASLLAERSARFIHARNWTIWP